MREIVAGGIIRPDEELIRRLEEQREITESRVRDFLQQNSLDYVVALVGDSESSGPVANRNQAILEEFFGNLAHKQRFAIQTGGTEGGIPQYGVDIARAHDLPTIGVYPHASRKYSLGEVGLQPVDLAIETPDIVYGKTTFGSETPVFANTIDGALILGGGYGTRTEVSTFLKVNKGRERDRRGVEQALACGGNVDPHKIAALKNVIYLCPIAGTGKTAEELAMLRMLEDAGDCLPAQQIRTGEQAAEFINTRLPAQKQHPIPQRYTSSRVH